jgi:predicted RNA binding protein YcfA (HicA-like mRNA interferase family)
MNTRKLISILQREGFVMIRANKHYMFNKGSVTVAVPRHKEVNIFLARKILKQAVINS